MIPDSALDHLRAVTALPDLGGTRYEPIAPIGTGGMGTVYAADDTLLKRRVALKVIDLPDEGGTLAERIRREAEVLARLEHPGIVPVHDAGTLPDGRPFYAMKLVEGETLDRHLARVPSRAERLRLFLGICETVAFAHARGVLHLDLKPANVMVGPFGEVLVMDWGLARTLQGGAPGSVAGTPGYMAPEQERGEVPDERTDVHALGVLLRGLIAPAADRLLPAIAARASAPERTARYASVADLARDLRRYLDGEAVEAYPEGPIARIGREARKHRVAIILVLAYLVARCLVYFTVRR